MKSATIDHWNYKLLDKFKKQGGNAEVNAKYEAKLSSALKPNPSTDTQRLEQFIRQKYEDKKWYSSKGKRKPKVIQFIHHIGNAIEYQNIFQYNTIAVFGTKIINHWFIRF